VRRYRAFSALCAIVRSGLLESRPFDVRPLRAWQLLIELGSNHLVTPVVAWSLKDNAGVPDDVRSYFDSVLTLNCIRNEHMLEGLRRVATALNAIDIEPVLLKSAAHLVEQLYPEPGLRILRDLDILIPEDRAQSAVGALRDIGFTGSIAAPENHHHLPGMTDPESGLDVELHGPPQRQLNHSDGLVPRIDAISPVSRRPRARAGSDTKCRPQHRTQ
jgi:Uncharacterised nucleotidyltransferase